MSADPSSYVAPGKAKNVGLVGASAPGASDFATRLRWFRKAQGLTQEALARAAGVSAKFISQIENRHTNPSIDVVARLIEQGLKLPMPVFFAQDLGDDGRAELAQIAAFFGGLPADVRRRALRLLKSLLED